MGRTARPKPNRLAHKLLDIRTRLDLTQGEMIKRLGYNRSPLYPSSLSEFENGKREPPLLVLLQYGRVAGVPVEVLIDDDLNLPEHLPAMLEHDWIMKPVRTGRHR